MRLGNGSCVGGVVHIPLSSPSSPPPHLVGAAGGSGSGSGSMACVLMPGDVVEVVEGDLMNLQGKVTSVEGDTITVIPRHEDLKVSNIQ